MPYHNLDAKLPPLSLCGGKRNSYWSKISFLPVWQMLVKGKSLKKNSDFCENAEVPCSSLAAVHMMSLQTLK